MPSIRFTEFVEKCAQWRAEPSRHVTLVIGHDGTQKLFGHMEFENFYKSLRPADSLTDKLKAATDKLNATTFINEWNQRQVTQQRETEFRKFTFPSFPRDNEIASLLGLINAGYFETLVLTDVHDVLKKSNHSQGFNIEFVRVWEIRDKGIEHRLRADAPVVFDMGDLLYRYIRPTSHYTGVDVNVVKHFKRQLEERRSIIVFWGWSGWNVESTLVCDRPGDDICCLGDQDVSCDRLDVMIPGGDDAELFAKLARELKVVQAADAPGRDGPAISVGILPAVPARPAVTESPLILGNALIDNFFNFVDGSPEQAGLVFVGMGGGRAQTRRLAQWLSTEIPQRTSLASVHVCEADDMQHCVNLISTLLEKPERGVVVAVPSEVQIDIVDIEAVVAAVRGSHQRTTTADSDIAPFSAVIVCPRQAILKCLDLSSKPNTLGWRYVDFRSDQVMNPENVRQWLNSTQIASLALMTDTVRVPAVLDGLVQTLIDAVDEIEPSEVYEGASDAQVGTMHHLAELWMIDLERHFDGTEDPRRFMINRAGGLLERAIQTVRSSAATEFSLSPVKQDGPEAPPDPDDIPLNDFQLDPKRR